MIANVATATRPRGWRPGVFVCFGLVNPDTLAMSNMLGVRGRDQQGSSIDSIDSIERPTGVYLFKHQ